MARYIHKNKRERLLDSLSLGSRTCNECNAYSLKLVEHSFNTVECYHCLGEWEIGEDKYTLTRNTFDNVKPLYLEEGAQHAKLADRVHPRTPNSFAPQDLYAKSWEQKEIKKTNSRKCLNIKDITLAICVGQ